MNYYKYIKNHVSQNIITDNAKENLYSKLYIQHEYDFFKINFFLKSIRQSIDQHANRWMKLWMI